MKHGNYEKEIRNMRRYTRFAYKKRRVPSFLLVVFLFVSLDFFGLLLLTLTGKMYR